MAWYNFKKKEKKVSTNEQLAILLIDYYKKAKKLGLEDNEIRERFEEKKYPNWLIDYVINFERRNKMAEKKTKKHKEDDFEDEEDEEEESEDEEDEDAEEEEEVKRTVKKELKKAIPEEKEITNEQISNVLLNHENRIKEIESWIFRVKSQ